jgi:hypothetical protein
MYIWLHTNGELTAFPGNKTMARELDIDVDTVKTVKKSLRAKGWTSYVERRKRPDGGDSTVVEKVHLPWGKISTTPQRDFSTTTLEDNFHRREGEKLHQQKEYSFEVPLSSPAGPQADSVKKQDSDEDATDLPTNQFEADLKSESKTVAANPNAFEAEDKANPNPDEDEFAVEMPLSGVVYNRTDILLFMGDCWSAFKSSATPTPDEFRFFAEILAKCDDNTCYPSDAMTWAQTHIFNPKLLGGLRSVKGLHKAICGEGVSSTNGLLAQYKDHQRNIKACGVCLKKVQGVKCASGTCKNWVALGDDGVPTKYCAQCAKLSKEPVAKGDSFADYCVECGWEKKDCTCPVAVGKGFDIEEAE